jgi:hypothetical protein
VVCTATRISDKEVCSYDGTLIFFFLPTYGNEDVLWRWWLTVKSRKCSFWILRAHFPVQVVAIKKITKKGRSQKVFPYEIPNTTSLSKLLQ